MEKSGGRRVVEGKVVEGKVVDYPPNSNCDNHSPYPYPYPMMAFFAVYMLLETEIRNRKIAR
jgi:hypothetical protein